MALCSFCIDNEIHRQVCAICVARQGADIECTPVAGLDTGHDLDIGAAVEEGKLAACWQG